MDAESTRYAQAPQIKVLDVMRLLSTSTLWLSAQDVVRLAAEQQATLTRSLELTYPEARAALQSGTEAGWVELQTRGDSQVYRLSASSLALVLNALDARRAALGEQVAEVNLLLNTLTFRRHP